MPDSYGLVEDSIACAESRVGDSVVREESRVADSIVCEENRVDYSIAHEESRLEDSIACEESVTAHYNSRPSHIPSRVEDSDNPDHTGVALGGRIHNEDPTAYTDIRDIHADSSVGPHNDTYTGSRVTHYGDIVSDDDPITLDDDEENVTAHPVYRNVSDSLTGYQ